MMPASLAAGTALVATWGAVTLGTAGSTGTDLAGATTSPSPEAAPTPGDAETTPARSREKVEFDRAPAPRKPTQERPRDRKRAVKKPAPVVVPDSGPGTFDPATAPTSELATATSLERTFTVEIEEGLPFDTEETAEQIRGILDDERGWTGVDQRPFRQVDESPDIRIVVATPDTTDTMCAPLKTNGEVSCRNGDTVVLNARRWASGIDDYRGALGMYRTYLVNHEVGHALGNGHEECPGAGEPAPVMQQQTYGLQGCSRNPWPTVS